MKRECQFWKREQKEQKPASANEDTTAVASDGEVLITVSYEDACLCASNHDIDWILDFGASYHATLSRENFISYKSGNLGKVRLGNIIYVILREWGMF